MMSNAERINPDFSDLTNPETILNHVKELKKRCNEELNPFPVDVFPEAIQEIIKQTNESLNFPIDFIGASILYAISVSIANTHKAEVKNGWQENAVLYLSIVGKAGTNKSHPISFALKPIEKKDGIKFQDYQKEKQQFDNIVNLSKKERIEQDLEEPIKPIWEQHLVTDFTPEALTEVHKHNKRGIGVYADELASWFKNFNRYNKGSEEQFWLSVWSGKQIRINRKTSEPTLIKSPFISVIGTIQPGVLNELANNRTENGFLDRLLFVVPDNLKKEYWSDKELNPVISENWEFIISKLLELRFYEDGENNIVPEVLKFSPEAKKLLYDFQRDLTDRSNNSDNEALRGIYAKIELYTIRLALCLELSFYACNESDKKQIGLNAIEGAIRLVEYFINSAIKVHSIVSNVSPLDKLPFDKQKIYNLLPTTFTTGEGVQIATNNEMPERTFKRFLSDRDLFSYNSRGDYEKKF